VAATKKTLSKVSGAKEDWEDTVAVSPDYLDDIDAENGSSEEESVSDASVTSQDSIIWLGRPPSLPLIVVVERLCGFITSSAEEAKQIRQQVATALSQDDECSDAESKEEQQQDHDSLSRNFDARVKELFENGVANHGDTSNTRRSDNYSLAVIEYPEFLSCSD